MRLFFKSFLGLVCQFAGGVFTGVSIIDLVFKHDPWSIAWIVFGCFLWFVVGNGLINSVLKEAEELKKDQDQK